MFLREVSPQVLDFFVEQIKARLSDSCRVGRQLFPRYTPMDLKIDRAELAALLLESVVYGIFLVLFAILIITFFSRGAISSNRYIIPAALLMMLIATTHLVIDFLRVLSAFIPKDPQQTPDQFFKRLSNPYAVLNWALYAIQTTLGDGILVWRCYMLCDKKWWTVIPGVLLVSFNIANLVLVTHYLTFTVGSAFIDLTRPWLSSWIITTTAVQLCYSCAIIVQIWRKFNKGSRPIIAILIESCAVYTLFALALFIAYEKASDLDWVLLDMITPLVGVTFCLIVIQIHIHFQRVDSTDGLPGTWNARNRSTGTVVTSRSGSGPGVETVAIPGPKSFEMSGLASNRDVQHDAV